MNQAISFLNDLFLLLNGLVLQLWSSARNEFFIACAVGTVLAGLSWWLTHYLALKFNRQFSYRPQHYFFCGSAAMLTFWCTLLFFAFRFTGDVAERIVTTWESTLEVNVEWREDTFRKAYEAVYDLQNAAGEQLEDFTGRPHPDSDQDVIIPAAHEESRLLIAQVYAEEAVQNFTENHPLLSKILWVYAEESSTAIYEDIKQFFSATGGGEKVYPLMEAVRLAKRLLRQSMIGQIPRIMLISRIVLVFVFILAQALTLSLLIRSALADIKVR